MAKLEAVEWLLLGGKYGPVADRMRLAARLAQRPTDEMGAEASLHTDDTPEHLERLDPLWSLSLRWNAILPSTLKQHGTRAFEGYIQPRNPYADTRTVSVMGYLIGC